MITHDEAKKNYQVNPTVKAMIDDIQAKYKAESFKVVIDNSPVKLSGDRMDVRVRETNLGNAVADALLDYGQSDFTHKSNLAVTNGGGLRETIAKDKPITKGDIIAVLPFGNSVAQIQVTGQNIYDMFVKSLGSILQVNESGKNVFDENGQPLLEPFVQGNASGLAVGLPDGQMGNSEVGHLNMGAGRIVYQDLTKITKAIQDGDFFENKALLAACENVKKNASALHLYGLVSDGGVHSHNSHIYGLLELAKRQGITLRAIGVIVL